MFSRRRRFSPLRAPFCCMLPCCRAEACASCGRLARRPPTVRPTPQHQTPHANCGTYLGAVVRGEHHHRTPPPASKGRTNRLAAQRTTGMASQRSSQTPPNVVIRFWQSAAQDSRPPNASTPLEEQTPAHVPPARPLNRTSAATP